MSIGIEFSESQEKKYTEMAKKYGRSRIPGEVWNLSFARNRGKGIVNIWILNVVPGERFRFFKTQEAALVGKALLA